MAVSTLREEPPGFTLTLLGVFLRLSRFSANSIFLRSGEGEMTVINAGSLSRRLVSLEPRNIQQRSTEPY